MLEYPKPCWSIQNLEYWHNYTLIANTPDFEYSAMVLNGFEYSAMVLNGFEYSAMV